MQSSHEISIDVGHIWAHSPAPKNNNSENIFTVSCTKGIWRKALQIRKDDKSIHMNGEKGDESERNEEEGVEKKEEGEDCR